MFPTSIGLNVGEETLSMVCLRGTFRGPRIAAHVLHPIKGGTPLGDRIRMAGEPLRVFMADHRISFAEIYVGIPRQSVLLRYIDLPSAAEGNLRETLAYEMEKYSPFPIDHVFFDFHVIEATPLDHRMKVLVALVKRDFLDPIFELAQSVRGKLAGVEISSTAISNYFANTLKRKAVPVFALLMSRDNEVEVAVVRNGLMVHSRAIAIEKNGIDSMNCLGEEFKGLESYLDDEIPSMDVFFSGFEARGDWLEHLEKRTSSVVRLVSCPVKEPLSVPLFPAYGLALKGLSKVSTEINLLPPDLHRKRSRAGLYATAIIFGLVFFGAVGWGAGARMGQKEYLARLEGEIDRLKSGLGDIEKMHGEKEDLKDKIAFLRRMGENRWQSLQVLKELSDKIPRNSWVSSVFYSENDLRIEGYAESASDLIPILEASDLFEEAVFRSTITKSKDGKERFDIGLKIS